MDILPARAARLTAAQTGGVSGDALTFHAQLEKQGTACCSVERSGQNFVQVTGFTSFPGYCSTEEKTGQEKTARGTAGREEGMEMEKTEISKAAYDIQMLRCLLHYHERITMPVGQDACRTLADGKCPGTLILDQYSGALREAIQCIEIVHGL